MNKIKAGAIFPLTGKIPLTSNGFKDASNNQEKISFWRMQHPHCNWGLVTGRESGFFVLDVDLKHDGPNSLIELEKEYEKLPQTLTCKTGGGGFHYFFNYPFGHEIKNKASFVQGLDIRGDGGYVVMADSIHPETKKRYEWIDQNSPIVDAPQWLLDLITKKQPIVANEQSELGIIPNGQRNDAIFKLASRLFRLGLTEEAVYAALLEENEAKCNPPLEESEVITIHKSASKNLRETEEQPSPSEKVFYGVGGEIIKTVMPFTEADPMAILAQFLTVMGGVVGRTFSYRIGGTEMYPNEFCLIVGSSSKARKGTSFGIVEFVLKKRFPDFFKNNVASGLSSGEGLINRIKDSTTTTSSTRRGVYGF